MKVKWGQSTKIFTFLGMFLVLMSGGASFSLAQEWQELSIRTDTGLVHFQVEIADDQEERRIGLMNRTELDKDKGMLFDYGYAYEARMWMKNTLIPLDMLFVREDGHIAYVHHRAKPGDLTTITAGEPVRAVIELAGGVARSKGIQAGQVILHPLFKTSP